MQRHAAYLFFDSLSAPFFTLCEKAVDELSKKYKEPKTEKLYLAPSSESMARQLIDNADALIVNNLDESEFYELQSYAKKVGKLLIAL